MEMSLAKEKEENVKMKSFFLVFLRLTAFRWQHEVAFVVEIQSLIPLLILKELVTDFLHFECTVLVFVEVNFVFIDLMARLTFVAFQPQLVFNFRHTMCETEAFRVAVEPRERLNLVRLKSVARVLIEIEEKSTFHAVHLELLDVKFSQFPT